MKINVENYELFIMDYLDGNLDKMKKKELDSFLLMHPNIAHEINGLNELKIPKETTLKLDSDFTISLKKNDLIEVEDISEENYEEIFIAGIERDLNIQDDKNLQLFLKRNPSLTSEFELQTTTILQVDKSIIFKNKNLLKKKKRLVILWPAIATAAAFLFLSFWVMKPQVVHRTPILLSKVETKTIHKIALKEKDIQLESIKQPVFFTNIIFEDKPNTRVVFEIERIASIQSKQIVLENNDWEKEMLLMQSFALNRTQLYVTNYPEIEAQRSVVKMISSLLWKTTKGQIKNIKDDLINENLNFFQSQNVENLTHGFIAVKPIGKE